MQNQTSNDDVSHGTAVAGIIAGTPSTPKCVLGVAPGCSIVSIDVTDNEDGKVELLSLIEGIKMSI